MNKYIASTHHFCLRLYSSSSNEKFVFMPLFAKSSHYQHLQPVCDCRFSSASVAEIFLPLQWFKQPSPSGLHIILQINAHCTFKQISTTIALANVECNAIAWKKQWTICDGEAELQFSSWQLVWMRLRIGERAECRTTLWLDAVDLQCARALAHCHPL